MPGNKFPLYLEFKEISLPHRQSQWGEGTKGGGIPLEIYKIQDVNPHPDPLPQAGEGEEF